MSSSNITHCQVPSCVRAWFNDSVGDIDFYQMFLSQSESTNLHESIIYSNNDQGRVYPNSKYYYSLGNGFLCWEVGGGETERIIVCI